MGLPYVSSDDRIEPNVVLRNCIDTVNDQESRTIIGIDTGDDYLSYVLMNKQGVFYYETSSGLTASKSPFDVIRGHMRRFPKSIAVIDQGGELMQTRQLQAEFPGRVFLCFYRKDRKSLDLVQWGKDEEYWKVVVDRNRMMTLMVEQLRDIGRIRLNGTKEEWKEFAEHFNNIYREQIATKETREKDNRELYGNEYVWKRNGPDHYCHALLYALVGLQRYSGEMATVAGDSFMSQLPKGQIVNAEKVGYSIGDFNKDNLHDF